MRKPNSLLIATGDPLLDADAAKVSGVSIIPSTCETPDECLQQIRLRSPQALLTSPALAPVASTLEALIRNALAQSQQIAVGVLTFDQQLTPAEISQLQFAGAALITVRGNVTEAVASWLREIPKSTTSAPFVEAPASPLPPGVLPAAPTSQHVMRQKVVTFWGGKGGAGRSTLLVAVADKLSQIPGVRVCTVDLHPTNSSLAALAGKDGQPGSWVPIGEDLMSGDLTKQTVARALVPINSQWAMLTGPAGSDQWTGLLTDDLVTGLVEILRTDFEFILLDVPHGRTPVGEAALALSQQVMVVVSAFYPDVADTARALERAVSDGLLARDRCRLVLSQWADSRELPAADVGALIQLPVSATVPLAPSVALAAARTGTPVTRLGSPESRAMAEAVTAVAELISEAPVGRPGRRTWFRI